MGRYRPPQPKSSPYITADGYARLDTELKALWKRRAIVTRALSEAAAEGDRSENAEYIYRKKELREIDRRIRYLQKRLPDLKVVNHLPDNPQQVFFAAWVTLEDEQGKEKNLLRAKKLFTASSGQTNLIQRKAGLAWTHPWPKPC